MKKKWFIWAFFVVFFIVVAVLVYSHFIVPVKIGIIYYNSEYYGPNEIPQIVDILNRGTKRQVRIYYAGITDDFDMIEDILLSLHQEGVKYIVGPNTSSQAKLMIPLLEKYNMVALAPKVTSPLVMGISPNFYSIAPSDEVVAKKIAREMERDGIEKVVFFKDGGNPVFTQSFSKYFEDSFSGRVLGSEMIRGFNFSLSFNRLRAADAVFFLTTPVQTGFLAQKIKDENPGIKMYASDYSVGKALFEYGGQGIEGLKIVCLYDRDHFLNHKDSNPLNMEDMRINLVQDNINFYDALNIFLDLIERYGDDPEIIKQKIKGYSYSGLGGRIFIDENGFPHHSITIFNIRNGKFKQVVPGTCGEEK